jgi:hypothetical protein
MAAPTNAELIRRLRVIAKTAQKETVKRTLLLAADRLEKPGHKQVSEKRTVVLYSVWDNRTDTLVALDEKGERCAELMDISYNGFLKAIREGSARWKIEKRFADEQIQDSV